MMIGSPVTVSDASVALDGNSQTALAADANWTRSFLMLQAPASAVSFSFTHSTVTANTAGCFTLAANSAPFIFPGAIPQGPLYVKGTNGAVLTIMVGYGGS